MKVLHITSDYTRQRLYKTLFENLYLIHGLKQSVYAPLRSKAEIGVNRPNQSFTIVYSYILRKWHKIFFHLKVSEVLKDLTLNFRPDGYELVHAHFLFSDGAVAYWIKRKHSKPYVVSVRNTDINLFYKYAWHLRRLGNRILENADRIVLVSPAYLKKLETAYGNRFSDRILGKIRIIPNAVDPFWYRNIGIAKTLSAKIKILYVGDFTRNKRVPYLIQSIVKNYPHFEILIAGSGGKDEKAIRDLAATHSNVSLLGRIRDKKALLALYREATITAVLSRHETFGLTYIESLSQATPILYTKGEGVDGYFASQVGGAVKFNNEESLRDSINYILSNYNALSRNCLIELNQFGENKISKDYIDIYNECYEKS